MKNPDFIYKMDSTGRTIYTAKKIFWKFYLVVSYPDKTTSIAFLTKTYKN